MSIWESYNPNSQLVSAKEVIGETLEYLDHTEKQSAPHPRYNPNGDKQYAIINVIQHTAEGGEIPLSVTSGSIMILKWLRHLDRTLEKGEKVLFRFTYDDAAPSGSPRWGVEPVTAEDGIVPHW